MSTFTATRINTLGYGLFTILLISRWTTGNAFFTVPESLLQFGFTGGLVFAFAGCLAFLAMIPFSKKLRNESKNQELLPVLEQRLSDSALVWTKRMMSLGIYFGMISIGLAVSVLLNAVFYIPFQIGFAVFFICGWFIVFLGNLEWFTKFNVMKVGLLLLVMVMILIHSYLFEGTEPVYNGIRLYHPYLFFIENDRILPLLASVWLIMLGNMIMDVKMWGVLLKANRDKLHRGLWVTGLVWSTIPFGFSMIVLASIYQGGFDSIYTVFEKMFHRYESWPISIVLFCVFFIILFDTFWTQVRSLQALNGSPFPKKPALIVLLLAIFIIVLPAIIYFQSITLLELFFITGVFFAAAIPFFGALIWKKLKIGMEGPLVVGCATIIGWICYWLRLDYISVIIASLFSAGLIAGILYFRRKQLS
ncbi:hypothetical protein [Bacillus litorisediminis]|uniref:hypothetical protein n=1 Tax=Bacillus litorisediminis TaxID=2922713 RepID=UPI001FAB8B93|nr:hypothetical protein [Bacillus litorisediminis]